MAKRLKGPDNEDRLSLLPDDILVHNILSLLPMKEAASTSILARRWRFLCLWVRSLDFDASAEVVPVHPELWDTVFPDGGGEAASRYVQWVDGIINAYRGSTALRHFRVLFCLDYAFSDKIESWLSFCLAKGVEVLELDCFYSPSQHHQCRFPSLFPGQYYPTLKSLKSLILRGLDIPSDSLNHVLAGSPFLESLEVTGSFTLTDVTVAAPAGSRLRSIHMCDCYRMRSLIVSASTPDLVSFIYPGGVEEVHLEHAPRVVELVISEQAAAGSRTHFDLISHPLFRYFSQLEALRLQASNWHEAAHWLPRLPDPRRLKRLHLRVFGLGLFDNLGNRNRNTSEKLRGLASLINAAPWLERLTLEVGRIDSGLEIRDEFSGLDLQHLRVIEMVGFRGSRSVLAVRLIKAAAASVEKLILNLGYGGSTCYPRRPYRKEKIDRYTSLVRELIEKEAPSAKVALVFTGFKKFDTVDTS